MNCYRCATPLPDNSRFCFSCGALVSGDTAERTLPVEVDPELEAKLREDLGEDYVIERMLGRGGMAVVFLARDVHLDRRVAVKLLPPELTFGTGMVERFKREARTAATLDHPHIVPIYRVSTGRRLFWYAMKYLDGESLADVLERDQRLPFERAAKIIAQVAEALEFAHQHGVIHRDVKPANVMLDAKDWVTVTDFGIAKATGSQSLTGSGGALGTPYYMSPEQCAGKGKTITGAADQYSLGVMAYQMVSGHLPFTGESVIDIIKQHCFDPVPPLPVLAPEIPVALAAVIERALAKKPEERFASVTEFAKTFARAVTVPAPPSPVPGTVPAVPPQPAAGVARRRKAGRRGVLWGAGVVTAAAALAAVVLWPRAGEQATPPTAARDSARDATPTLPAVTRPGTTVATRDTGIRPPRDTVTPPRPSAPRVLRPARVFVRGIPPGATLALDGRSVRDSSLALGPGARHVLTVSLAGYEPWTDTLTPSEGEQLARWVQLQPRQQVAPPATVPTPAPAGSVAYLSVGSRPLAAISINGREMPSNPVTNLEVEAGAVRISFRVIDESGSWSFDTTVTLAVGERRNLGRIPLRRRP